MSSQETSTDQAPAAPGAGRYFRGNGGAIVVAASAFLLVAGIGAATSYLRDAPDEPRAARSGSDSDALARLKDYTHTIGVEEKAPTPEAGKMLPDVTTMIDRLAKRLETAPGDVKGWRMLGWSYFYTGRYKDAAAAYARAVELDPRSEDIKFEYEEAKAKAAEADTAATPPPSRADATGNGTGGPSADQVASFQAMPPQDREAAIRSMVDGLAARLEASPHDVDGWTRLMRSRLVLGEKEVATAALRKALEVFKGDAAASAKIAAAATQLGLQTE